MADESLQRSPPTARAPHSLGSILGYDSLEILSLLAIIILSFRKESLMQVSSIESIEAVLADLSSIKVLPLVQLALSRD